MLRLRRGTVTGTDPLTVEVEGSARRAWADESMVGEVREGDEVVVNTEALDLELGSGGFDVVHVNLTRGLDGGGTEGEHVMKLNYTSLQHAVGPVEAERAEPIDGEPVAVISLHGQLAPLAWAAGREAPGLKLGFVQGPGGALPGSLSRDVPALRERGLLAGHITAGPCHGGEHEAISVIGAIHAGIAELGWDAAVVGPGPGILGSASRFGHGGMAALDATHAAAAIGARALVVPRMSSADPRERHRGLSHHSESVLDLLLAGVAVSAPDPGGTDWPAAAGAEDPGDAVRVLEDVCSDRHAVRRAPADLAAYAEAGLPARTMGRGLAEDPLFFASAIAGGSVLARMAGES